MIVGGCKICKRDFTTVRDLLLHVYEHCSDIFYLNDNLGDEDLHNLEESVSFVTPEPAASPESPATIQSRICQTTLSKKLSISETVEECSDSPSSPAVSRVLKNLSTAALINRPTMVKLDTADNLKHFACSECDQIFDKAELYNDHLNVHITVSSSQRTEDSDVDAYREFKCIDCGGCFFGDVNRYRDHLKIAHGAETLICTVCEQQFGTTFELNRHMGAHNGGSYECQLCGACFRMKRHLSQHRCCCDQQPIDYSQKSHDATTSAAVMTLDRSKRVDDNDSQAHDNEDTLEDTSMSNTATNNNDYLEQILASTVSNRPKRPRLARFKKCAPKSTFSCKSKKDYCHPTTVVSFLPATTTTAVSKKLSSKNDNNVVVSRTGCKDDKIVSSYFLELVETNVCKYRHRSAISGASNSGNAFNCYLTKCMDMAAAIDNSQSSSQEI